MQSPAIFFFPHKKGKKKPPIPIDSGPCGTTVTSARIASRAAHPSCIPQTSAARAGCVISRRVRRVFASWFRVFADSRGAVTFCNVRFAFRFGERLPTGTVSLLFRPSLTSPIHPERMAEVRLISSSSSSRCPASSLCCPCLLSSHLPFSAPVAVKLA